MKEFFRGIRLKIKLWFWFKRLKGLSLKGFYVMKYCGRIVNKENKEDYYMEAYDNHIQKMAKKLGIDYYTAAKFLYAFYSIIYDEKGVIYD